MKDLGKQTGATVTSITNKVQEIEERFLGTEDVVEETDISI